MKCEHGGERQLMKTIVHNSTAQEVHDELHGSTDPKRYSRKFEVSTAIQGEGFLGGEVACFGHFLCITTFF